jgi:hypothetical protein
VTNQRRTNLGQLRDFLEAHRNELVDYVEGNQRPISMGDNIYTRLLNELVKLFPMEKAGVSGVQDKAHIELAIAIMESLWCGWLSQAKVNRKAYQDEEWPDKFKATITDAFDVGQTYASVRP